MAVRSTIEAFQPQVVINAAAYTAVDRAEDEPAQAEALRILSPIVDTVSYCYHYIYFPILRVCVRICVKFAIRLSTQCDTTSLYLNR